LFLDNYHLPAEFAPHAKRIARDFILNHFGDRDVAAIVYAGGIEGQDLTNDRKRLIAAVDRLKGSFDFRETASIREIKSRSVVATLREISSSVGHVTGRRKAVVYVGISMDCQVSHDFSRDPGPAASGEEKMFGNLSSAGTGAPDDVRATILCNDAIGAAVRQAVRSDVTVYSIDLRGSHNPDWVAPTVDGRGGAARTMVRNSIAAMPPASRFDGFHVVAEQTGGFAVTGTNAFSRAWGRIVAESSVYYLIGYYSSNPQANGRFRRHVVTVTRPGLKVQHRSGYVSPR
jgi:VWFA-related protein